MIESKTIEAIAANTGINPELLPSSEDIQHYQTHGWWVSQSLFNDEELNLINTQGIRHQQYGSERKLPASIAKQLDWTPEVGDILRTNDYIIYQNNTISNTALKPIIGAIAALLAGTEEIRLFNSSFVDKPPAKDNQRYNVGYHTDKAYWQTCSSNNMLTAWVPMEDTSSSNGTLTVLDGSHLWPTTEKVLNLIKETNYSQDDNSLVARAEELGLDTKVVPLELNKGQVSFHHCLLFHGSGANYSKSSRRALILHMQDQQNRYVKAYNDQGTLLVNNNDLMVTKNLEGWPDYADKDFCPVIWRHK